MSLKQNDEWLEAAYSYFDEHLEMCNYDMCKAIIDDVRDQGFNNEADTMQNQLNETPIIQFVTKSPYQNL